MWVTGAYKRQSPKHQDYPYNHRPAGHPTGAGARGGTCMGGWVHAGWIFEGRQCEILGWGAGEMVKAGAAQRGCKGAHESRKEHIEDGGLARFLE